MSAAGLAISSLASSVVDAGSQLGFFLFACVLHSNAVMHIVLTRALRTAPVWLMFCSNCESDQDCASGPAHVCKATVLPGVRTTQRSENPDARITPMVRSTSNVFWRVS